ncbi:hypothetical protein Tco_0262631 [Tanacetum coccineum]
MAIKDEVVYADLSINQKKCNGSVDNGNYSLGYKLGMKDTHVAHVGTGVLDMMRKNGLPAQDTFGRWMNYIIAVSPGAIDDPFLNPEPFFISQLMEFDF